MILRTLVSFVLFVLRLNVFASIDGLSDSVYFDIIWPGSLPDITEDGLNPLRTQNAENEIVVLTPDKEQYKCIIPQLNPENEDDNGESFKQVELELLRPLFYQTTCTYRLETYWTYELCHGKHLRQYHEEKEAGKPPKLQEYYLGKYKLENLQRDLKKAKELQEESAGTSELKVKNIQGADIPYYEVLYDEGTACDLTGQPRRVALHFVCQPEGRGEVYELKEVSSCEYEVVVLTNLLCPHPAYGPKKEKVNTIECYALDNSPRRPIMLDILELENTASQYNKQENMLKAIWNAFVDKNTNPQQELVVDTVATRESDEEPGLENDDRSRFVLSSDPPKQSRDTKLLAEFLEGKHCIYGGTGWWKHEFCYGKHVTQFHEDSRGKNVIYLGRWNSAAHLEWILNNPKKEPKPVSERTWVTHLYSDGDYCDISAAKRFVEVRLKCSGDEKHPNSIALYLVEPRPCEYKLVVESLLFCHLVVQADSHGLITNPILR